ncbi:MAG: hypothetical protein ACLP05_03975, partial [Candidatus Kryptoniota bacterium]
MNLTVHLHKRNRWLYVNSFLALGLALTIFSCAEKPTELYNDGMTSFISGKYDVAQEDFAKGIKRNGGDS